MRVNIIVDTNHCKSIQENKSLQTINKMCFSGNTIKGARQILDTVHLPFHKF